MAREHNPDTVERAVLAALRANADRPPLLPLETESEMDAYVAGFEQAARLVAIELGYPELLKKWGV
jgi:hypothetical protein